MPANAVLARGRLSHFDFEGQAILYDVLPGEPAGAVNGDDGNDPVFMTPEVLCRPLRKLPISSRLSPNRRAASCPCPVTN